MSHLEVQVKIHPLSLNCLLRAKPSAKLLTIQQVHLRGLSYHRECENDWLLVRVKQNGRSNGINANRDVAVT